MPLGPSDRDPRVAGSSDAAEPGGGHGAPGRRTVGTVTAVVLPLRDFNPTRRTPVITYALILACVGTYLFAQSPVAGTAEDIRFTYEYAAIPCELTTGQPLSEVEIGATLAGEVDACGVGGEASPEVFPAKDVFLASIVSMFLHGGLLHLGGNMLFLYVFGNNIEDHLGRIRYLLFYLLAGVVATAGHVAIQLDSTIPVVGASGAVAGVMGAYLVWFPKAPVLSLIGIFPVPLPAFLVLGFWFMSQFAIDPSQGIAWMAHVAGFIFGVVVGLAVRESPVARRRAWTPAYRDSGRGRWDDRKGGRR